MNRAQLAAVAACWAIAIVVGVVAGLALGPDRRELPAACRELVTAADQALIGAGQTVTDDATNTSHSGLTRLQREAQLNTIADRYERARDDCLEASR